MSTGAPAPAPAPSSRSSRSSRSEYERRIHAVLAHIDAHLDHALPLDTLAEVAHFSPFHFHRLFRAWTGETLGDYLRRRRLEVAAQRLSAQPRLSVLELALGVGFGSGEAFARAFKLRFGVSPSAWRSERQRKIDQAEAKADQDAPASSGNHRVSFYSPRDTAMDVKLIDMPRTHIAYFRHTGPYGAGVGRFWQEQVAPWMAENDLFGHTRYGIAHDDPDITAPDRCRYDACVELAPDALVSGQPLRTELAGGRHACLAFEGTSDQIDAAWHALMRDWLPASGLQLDARPCLEHYPPEAGYDAATGVFQCRLCIPVAPL